MLPLHISEKEREREKLKLSMSPAASRKQILEAIFISFLSGTMLDISCKLFISVSLICSHKAIVGFLKWQQFLNEPQLLSSM